MSRNTKTAVDKAKKTGVKKKFYITSPSGWALVEILPKLDMAARLASDAFAHNRVDMEDYKAQKNILYEYIEGIDDWTREVFEKVLQNNIESNFSLKIHKDNVKSSKFIYCNTEIGLDAYRSFVKCDTINRCMVHGLRYGVISEDFYAVRSKKLFTIVNNCKADIGNMVASLPQKS